MLFLVPLEQNTHVHVNTKRHKLRQLHKGTIQQMADVFLNLPPHNFLTACTGTVYIGAWMPINIHAQFNPPPPSPNIPGCIVQC